MKKKNVTKKSSCCFSKTRDISEIEKVVDKILFENKDKSSSSVEYVGNKKQECFDPKSFSLDERKKESIYFVKVKKKSDGKKEKHLGKKPTVVDKKDKFFFGTHKKSQEKKSLGVVDSSEKDVSSSRGSIADLPPNEANWLEKRLHKVSQDRGEKSSSLLSDKNSSQSDKSIKGEERKKIISSFTKTPTEALFDDEGKTTSSDSEKSNFKHSGQDEFIGKQKPDEKPSMVDKPVKNGDKDKTSVPIETEETTDIGPTKGHAKSEELSLRHTKKMNFSGKKVSKPSDALLDKIDDKKIRSDSKTKKFQFGGFNIKTSRRSSVKTDEHVIDGELKIQKDEKSSAVGEVFKEEKIGADVASKVEDVKPEDASSKDEEVVSFSAVHKANSFEGHQKKTTEDTGDESSEIKKVIKKDDEPDKKTGRFKKLLKKGDTSKKITDTKADESNGEQSYPIKTGHAFSGKPEKTDEEILMESMPDKDTSQSSKKVALEEITPDGQIQFLKESANLKSVTLKNLGYLKGSYDELDFYPLEEPFAYVEVIRENDTLDKRYVLVEIELTEDEARILKFLDETLGGFCINTNELEEKGEEGYLIERMDQIIEDYALKFDDQSKKKIVYFLKKQFLGLGKLEILMKDPNIEDISCDGSGVCLFLYHRKYGSLKSNVIFDDEEVLSDFVVKLAQKCGKHISIAEPMLDATMPDGSRLQATLSTEVTTKGSTFTIRKFKEDPFSPPDLIEFNTMSAEMVAYLWLAVENGINALVAGGTAAGKTSTLNAFALFIPREAKIVSIEETREINLPHPNWIPGVSRSGFGEVVGGKVVGEIDMYDLMKAALRQRPEYILVGEIRGREAYVLFQAMATGHTTYSTVHADSAASLIHRLEGKPINIPRIMLQALDIVCIQVISRIKNKRARRCKQIIEIIDIDPTTKEILTNEVFRWDPITDKFEYSGKSYILERIRGIKDLGREEMTQEIKRRAELLEWMNVHNIREFKKVATLIAQYVDNPVQLMEKIHDGKLL